MFLTKAQQKQVYQIAVVGIVLIGIVFLFGRLTEGFAKSAEQYVSGNGPFRYTLKDLQEMAAGKSQLQAIEFYDYYEKKDTKGNIIQKGFILQDAPDVGLQNETGGPRVTFGNNKVVYAANSKRTPKFPISLSDSQIASGIIISNTAGALGGSTEIPLDMMDAKGRKVAKMQFTRGDKSKEDPGKGAEMKIKFIFV
jgi:hypothetical protein